MHKMKQDNNYGNDCPYIEIQLHEELILVSNAALRLIGNPSTIRFLWNAAKRSLIIEPVNADDPNSIEVESSVYEQGENFFIYSSILIDKMWEDDGSENDSYRIVARYNEPFNVAIFDMKNAVVCEPQEIPDAA